MVGWFYGRVLRSTRGVPPRHPAAPADVRAWNNIIYAHTRTRIGKLHEGFDVLYYVRRFGRHRFDIAEWETSGKVFFGFPFLILDIMAAHFIRRTVREQRRGTDDLWKSYKTPYEREVAAVVKNESYIILFIYSTAAGRDGGAGDMDRKLFAM